MDDASSSALSFAQGDELVLDPDESGPLAEVIARRVEAKPDAVIRSYGDDGRHQAQTRAQLWRRAGDVAAALQAAGSGPGAHVVILADDVLDFVPSFWACLRSAAIPVALMNAAKGAAHRGEPGFAEAVGLLQDPLFVVDDVFAALFDRLGPAPERAIVRLSSVGTAAGWTVDRAPVTQTAYLVATSGSTGRLKLVELSEPAVMFRNFDRRPPREPAQGPQAVHALGTAPMDTVTGQHVCFLHPESLTQISSRALTVRPTAILDAIEAFELDTISLTNSMMNRILADDRANGRVRRLASLRAIGLGAEPISAGLAQDFSALLSRHGADGVSILAGYGTTETGSLVKGSSALLMSGRTQPVSLGRPAPGVAMRIVDEDGAVAPAGDVGALELSCPAKMFTRYWGDPQLTADSFTADGWWKTGDLGQLIDGEITLRGRTKEVLIQNARKLSLADIDAEIQAALGVGAVAHACLLVDPETQADTLGVAFDTFGALAEDEAVEAIRTAVVRRFGVRPQTVAAIPADRIPRTAVGKVRRGPLGQLMAETIRAPGPAVAETASEAGPTAPTSRLETIWSEVLGLQRAPLPADHFFDLGGDSLRALTLHLQLVDAFSVRITGEEFFADPTFSNLQRLVKRRLHGVGTGGPEARPDMPWPLPEALRHGLASALAHWPGQRPTEDGSIIGFNLDGDQPPIFWVFNAPQEPVALSRELGPGRPLYAIRSGYELTDYREDEIQAFALRYVSEIVRLRPTGPIFVGGNCQGAIIALAIAQHLLRRKRHIPLLVLMDWAFELQPYQGRVLLIGGADNHHHNPRLAFANPELAWARAFAGHAFAEITGGYAKGFEPEHIGGLGRAVVEHMRSALSASPTLMPDSGYRASVAAKDPPREMRLGESRTIAVLVTNQSDIVWAPTSGLRLSSRWLRRGRLLRQTPQPRAEVPRLGPLETATVRLTIAAPRRLGELTLSLDLVEEGNRWFNAPAAGDFTTPVRITGGRQWRRRLRSLGVR